MSIQGNGGGGKVPPQTPLGKSTPPSTDTAKKSTPKDAAKSALAPQKASSSRSTGESSSSRSTGASRDGFDTSGSKTGAGLFAGGAVTGVRTSGVRQMGKVLEQTAQRVLVEIHGTRAEVTALTEELVASGFSEDGLSTTSPRRKDARRRLLALRKREIALRRRLRLIGVEANQTDPVSSRTLQSLQESLDSINDNAPTASKDRTLLLLQEGGADPNNALRLSVVDGNRGADVAQALLGNLPGQVTSEFLTRLLVEGPNLESSAPTQQHEQKAALDDTSVIDKMKLHASIFAGAA